MSERIFEGREKLEWIVRCGWKGLCPRCGEGKMFR
jgi:uncharacterized protein (DUF983 family)